MLRVLEALARRLGLDAVRSIQAVPWILYAIGTAARLASIAMTGRFGYVGDASSVVSTASSYQQILSMLSLCAPLAVCAAALQVYRERVLRAYEEAWQFYLVWSPAFGGAAGGGKQSFVIAALAVAIPFGVVVPGLVESRDDRLHTRVLVYSNPLQPGLPQCRTKCSQNALG